MLPCGSRRARNVLCAWIYSLGLLLLTERLGRLEIANRQVVQGAETKKDVN